MVNVGVVLAALVSASVLLTLNLFTWASKTNKHSFVPHGWSWFAVVVLNFIFIFSLSIGITSLLGKIGELQKSKPPFVFCSIAPLCLLAYWFFSVAHTFAQHAAAQVPLNKIVPTILIYFAKLAIALGMYRHSDGSFQELRQSFADNKVAILKYTVPACCMAFYDLLSFLSLGRLSPAKYQVLLHLRTVMIAFFWQFVMRRRLSAIQWAALMMCIWAALLTERRAIAEMLGGSDASTTLGPYATLACQYVLAVLGNLANEKLLNDVKMPVNAQNIIMYTIGSTALSFCIGIWTLVSGASVFPIQDFPLVMAPSVLWSILTLSLLGISAGYVLKTSGNIFKELVGMGVTFTTAVFDCLVLGNPFDAIDVQAVVSIAFGLGFFSLLHIVEGLDDKQNMSDSKKPYLSPQVLRNWLRMLACVVLVMVLIWVKGRSFDGNDLAFLPQSSKSGR